MESNHRPDAMRPEPGSTLIVIRKLYLSPLVIMGNGSMMDVEFGHKIAPINGHVREFCH